VAITGIMHLDMLQQFLIPQLDEDDQERRINFQQGPHHLITLEKRARTLTPISQVGGLVERRCWRGHQFPGSYTPSFFLMRIC
jgi:hypothetical protein